MKAKFKILLVLTLILASDFIQAQGDQETYRVVAISNDDSKKISESNEIELVLPLRVYLPTAFTPNGDGLNDEFGAVGEGIDEYKLVVFNRWGEVIFTSNNLSSKWDGKYKGKAVPFGSYNYQLLAQGKEIGEVNKTGRVTVIN